MGKFLKITICFIVISFLGVFPAYALNPVNAYFFYGDSCPHCAKELLYLQTVKIIYPNLKIKKFEIYRNFDNAKLLQETGWKLGINVSGVPCLIIGDKHFIGYAEGITSAQIEAQINKCSKTKCPDSIAEILGIDTEKKQKSAPPEKQNITEETKQPVSTVNTAKKQNSIEKTKKPVSNVNAAKKQDPPANVNADSGKIINLPLLGKINIHQFSLPVLTILIGVLDGFNPCAMWTLLFLISLLLGMKNRKKMWILGTAFIAASAFVYFIFMSAWLNLLLFLGFVIWVRIIIGGLAIFGGTYSLKSFFIDKNTGCKVTGSENRQKVFQKLKSVVEHNSFCLALCGIIVLAFMVNLVELICSAGLPAIYTQVLALNKLPAWQYYLYIFLYIFFFMIDDLFVFFAAMITLEMTGITTKHVKYSQLVGGIIMLIIGFLLILKPQWLMFG